MPKSHPKLPKTTLKQKFFLILFGIFLTLILLEVGLRIGGIFATMYEEKDNQVTFTSNEFRILCIGESTTALGGKNSYPSQLEDLLNDKNLGIKFNTINKGAVSKSTTYILNHLEENMNKYKPDLVIAMIGINDQLDREDNVFVEDVKYLLENFYSFRFFELLCHHLKFKIDEVVWHKKIQPVLNTPESEGVLMGDPKEIINKVIELQQVQDYLLQFADKETKESKKQTALQVAAKLKQQQHLYLISLVRYYRGRDDIAEAKLYLGRAMALIPDNYRNYFEMAGIYKVQKEYLKAIQLLEKALSINPDIVSAKIEMARCYEAMGKDRIAAKLYSAIPRSKNETYPLNREIGDQLFKHNRYKEAEQVYQKAMVDNPSDPDLYDHVAATYTQLGEIKKAEKYLQKAKTLRKVTTDILPMTAYNYERIASIVKSHGAKLICMQYPLRSVDMLKKLLGSDGSIIYVENKINFEEGLKISPYSDYFSDFFAGDFGHCTLKGNHLIAKNLAEVIEKEVLNIKRQK